MGELMIRSAGDRALLVEPPDLETMAGLVDRLRADPVPGVVDFLPAARTVLITLAPRTDAAKVGQRVRDAWTAGAASAADVSKGADAVEISVRYDGADLGETAELLGLSTTELIARHTGVVWRCAFIGFAPGFGYLEAPEAGLSVPRRDQSRTAVPAGAVALAGGYSAVYPRTSPGGWRLIGTTRAPMWDLDRPEPGLLWPGTRVRFVAVEEL
ncbi:5-oxoprolinase subunit B family protein [Nocardia alni]|uniref:5-oxoprolinase subunit B family protein n=1 Tax=Nocardia alni TaxID=2815723 RepID=UPI001C2286F7|nr:allophanate hydrolase subunit 1 [Nocardia alni]